MLQPGDIVFGSGYISSMFDCSYRETTSISHNSIYSTCYNHSKGWNTLWYYVLSFVKQVSPLSQTRFNVNLQALHNTITSIKASELTLLWLT